MAIPGTYFILSEQDKKQALKYVEDSRLFKNRLASFLCISRPTLDKVLEDNPEFFTALKRADALFCKSLIDVVKKKNPFFILKTRYREEFNEVLQFGFDPETEIKRIHEITYNGTTKDIEGYDNDELR